MAKISRLSKIDKPCVYIYAGVALDARIPEVQPVFRAATRSPADRTPKFGTARFPANSSASFSRETVAFRRRPPPPRGSSRRSLHRSGLMFLNTSPFDCFPFVFVFPVVFPASSSMAGHVLRLLRPPRRPAPLLRARRASGRIDPRLPRRRPSRAPAHSRAGPPPVPCSSASRRWLLLGRVPCRPQPPHSVLPAGPASAALCSRPGLVKLSTSSRQGCSRSPLRSHHVLLPVKKMT